MENWVTSINQYDGIVLNTQIKLVRNFDNIAFPEKISAKIEKENNDRICDILQRFFSSIGEKVYLVLGNSDENYYEFFEKYLIDCTRKSFNDRNKILVNESETVSVLLNNENHLKIKCVTAGLNLEEALGKANIIDDEIEKSFNYAFDEEIGYLMASPLESGNGLEAKVILHLPALSFNNDIERISKSLERMDIEIKSKYKDTIGECGNIYEICSRKSVKFKEQDVIGNLKGAILNIIAEEKKAREVLLVSKRNVIEDKIFRSYAILQSAILLTMKETIEQLSYLRLGIEMGILDLDKSNLNKIMLVISDWYIKKHSGNDLDEEVIQLKRANLIKEILK